MPHVGAVRFEAAVVGTPDSLPLPEVGATVSEICHISLVYTKHAAQQTTPAVFVRTQGCLLDRGEKSLLSPCLCGSPWLESS